MERFIETYTQIYRPEEVIDTMLALFDEETAMKNHDAAVERKVKKDTAGLMAFLASSGRTDDIVTASNDESFFDRFLAEFRSGKMTAKDLRGGLS